MPTLRPRKRARASSSSVPRSSPGDHDRAGVGALQPGHDHQQRGLARAGRADQADRLAAPYMQVDVFEDMNARRAAAERQIDAARARSRGRAPQTARCRSCSVLCDACGCGRRRAAPVIWELAGLVQVFAWLRRRWLLACRRCGAGGGGPSGADRGARRFPDRRASGLPANAAFPAKLEQALKAKGMAVEIANAGRLRRHGVRRAGPARLVGAGGNRRRHRRARRQ